MTAAKQAPTPQEETLARSDALLPRSLQTIIDSPNFRDYEKAMARKLLLKRNSHDALVAALEKCRTWVCAMGQTSHTAALLAEIMAALKAASGHS